ncbi:hypothetical protein M9H77_03020 [Catharanthus roseus]|uniref:Uncharacterized protein n=1 Tax=Catharanthus roseus TaxID=4058 RepID=A0ACC0CAC3_CATRO|nr:hypothetical protein M9H77_03020 [Catharanthus roseus]
MMYIVEAHCRWSCKIVFKRNRSGFPQCSTRNERQRVMEVGLWSSPRESEFFPLANSNSFSLASMEIDG